MNRIISLGKNEKMEKIKTSKRINHVDFTFLSLLVLLLVLGSLMIFSASFPYAKSHYEDGFYYIKRHLIFLVIGLVIMYVFSKIRVEVYKKIAPIIYTVCMVLLVLVLFGGFSEGVAKRWLGIPGTPLSFQPSELMKFGIIIMLSWYIDKTKEKKKNIFYEIVLPGLILFGACALVMLEKHLS